MTFLLDTNVISELRRPERADPRVRAWAASTEASHFYLSVITVLEIEQGLLLVERRDTVQAQHLRAWFEGQVRRQFDGRILPIDTAVAMRCAGLHVPNPRSERDALIAATGLVHGMTIVTRNVADFRGAQVPLLDPWEASPNDRV